MSQKKISKEPNLRDIMGSINIYSSVAVYVQIENSARFAIASGILKPGDKLPSVRELSDWLQINPNTVAKSYRDLEVMGLLYTRRGMGVFVQKSAETKCRERCRQEIAARAFEVISEAKAAGMKKPEINDIIKRCLKLSVSPYSETPKELLALAKKRGK
jgi:GntR family transcriptional regulator